MNTYTVRSAMDIAIDYAIFEFLSTFVNGPKGDDELANSMCVFTYAISFDDKDYTCDIFTNLTEEHLKDMMDHYDPKFEQHDEGAPVNEWFLKSVAANLQAVRNQLEPVDREVLKEFTVSFKFHKACIGRTYSKYAITDVRQARDNDLPDDATLFWEPTVAGDEPFNIEESVYWRIKDEENDEEDASIPFFGDSDSDKPTGFVPIDSLVQIPEGPPLSLNKAFTPEELKDIAAMFDVPDFEKYLKNKYKTE